MENLKLINKIQKMFNLANDAGAAKGEAENALRMANKLMEKHHLQMMDLQIKEDIVILKEDGTRWMWVKQLYLAISELYSCTFYTAGSYSCNIVGAESDAITASIVIKGLIENIKRASKGKGTAFRLGAVISIREQCLNIMETRKTSNEIVPGTGLALVDVYSTKLAESKAHLRSVMGGRLKAKSSKSRYTEDGKKYGSTLNPNAHLSNKRALNQL